MLYIMPRVSDNSAEQRISVEKAEYVNSDLRSKRTGEEVGVPV